MASFAERVSRRVDAPCRGVDYWSGPVNRDAGFTNVIVYCVGPEKGGPVCGHNAMLRLADLPDWDWRDISAHLRCTKCGAVGYVDTRNNWSDVINFNKGFALDDSLSRI